MTHIKKHLCFIYDTRKTHFSFSRSTLYKTLKKQGIKTFKEGRIAYIKNTDFTQLKKQIKTQVFSQKKDTFTDFSKNTNNLTSYFQKKLEKEQEKNEKLQEENQTLVRELGRWEGVARTLKDQNDKLLTLQAPPKPEKIGFFQKIFGKK